MYLLVESVIGVLVITLQVLGETEDRIDAPVFHVFQIRFRNAYHVVVILLLQVDVAHACYCASAVWIDF